MSDGSAIMDFKAGKMRQVSIKLKKAQKFGSF